MFNMLSFFNETRLPPDPFATRKTVALWLDELPNADTAATQTKILDALVQLRDENKHQQKDHLEVIMALDDYAQPLLATLSEQYLRNSRMSTAMETKLWQAIHDYYSEISIAYYSVISIAVANPTQSLLGPFIAVISLRALHNLGHLFKWRFMHYDQLDENLWHMLHDLYKVAESREFINQPMALYNAAESSCANQYVRALLLAQIHPSTLQAKQIELADGWLLKWVHLVEIATTPTTGRYHFYVDLTKPAGAEPIANPTHPDSCRCWDASLLIGQLRRIRSEIKKRQQNPKTENDPRLPEYLKVLDYIELQWNPGNLGKLRKDPRRAAKKILQVVHGFNAIRNIIKDGTTHKDSVPEYDAQVKYAEMVDIQLFGFVTMATRNRNEKTLAQSKAAETPYENWEAENESAKGYLARSPSNKHDSLRLGCLAGLKSEGDEHWQIAVVRRLSKPRNATTRIGMEVLAQKPALLTLQALSKLPQLGTSVGKQPASPNTEPIAALLTSTIQDGQLTLIIEIPQYAKERQFKIITEQSSTLITLGNILEKGDSWICVEASLVS